MSALRRVAVGMTGGLLLAASLMCWTHKSTFAQSNSNGYDDGDVTTAVEIAVSSDGTQVEGEVLGDVDFDSFDDVDSIEVYGALSDANDTNPAIGDDPYDYPEGEVDLLYSTDGSASYNLYGETDYCISDDEGDDDCGYYNGVPTSVNVALPSINSIAPMGGTIGASGTITVQGANLETDAGALPTVMTNDSDITISVQSATASQATLTYQIASQATAGIEQLTLSNALGTSNAVNFTVGYPPAVVTGLSPSVWQTGTSFTLVITGNNFGSAPTVSVSGTGVTSSGATNSYANGTQTQTTITVAASAPSQTVVVTIIPGNVGSTYMCSCSSGQSPDGTDSATVTATTPAPQIMMVPASSNLSSCAGGTVISTGGETDVFAGQQMLLCAAPPPGLSIASASWSFDSTNDITGGFVDGAGDPGSMPSAAGGGSEAADPDLTQGGIQFYFVNPGTTETATLHWTLTNGDPNGNSSSADFNIQGPTGNLLLTATMPTDGSGVQVLNNANGAALSTTGVALGNTQVGITFQANASLPADHNQSFTWVQLINPLQRQYINSNGPYSSPATPSSGIDMSYPITNASATTTNDTPSAQLPPNYGEAWETFTATTFLMWDPGIPPAGQSSCNIASTTQTMVNGYPTFTSTPSTCSSIPIPLSSVTWHWSGCTINALSNQTNGTTWFRSLSNGCPVETLSAPQPAEFPQWTGPAAN